MNYSPVISGYETTPDMFFYRRHFPSLSIGGRVRDGGNYNLKKPFSHSLPSLGTQYELIRFHGLGNEEKACLTYHL